MTAGSQLSAALVLAAAMATAQQATVKVPAVGCEAGGQFDVAAPKISNVSVPLNPGPAAKLAYYTAGNGLGILAPRGWSCLGTIGSGGSTLFATPKPIDRAKFFSSAWFGFEGPVVIARHTFGETSGRFSVAEVILRVFSDYKAWARNVASEFPDMKVGGAPYAGDKLNYKGKAVVEFATPAQSDGLGASSGLKKSNIPTNGVAILIDKTPPDILLMSVRLPPGSNGLASEIVHQFERDTRNHPERLGLLSSKP